MTKKQPCGSCDSQGCVRLGLFLRRRVCENVDGDEDDRHADDVVETKEKMLAAIGSIEATMLAFTGPIWATPARNAVNAKTVPTMTSPPKVSTLSRQIVGS